MDENRAAEFTGRVLADSAAAATIVLAALGDRTGLFKDMAEHGPATSGELAGRTGLSERYVREWLGGMFAAGYLSYDDAQQRYALPAEHVPTLATEPGPAFFGGVHQELIGAIQRYDQVAEAFRRGGGVRQADLHPDVAAGTSRFTAQWHQNMLVQQWLPLVPETTARLQAGARVADVGCGTGQALIALARAFPAITATGYDVHPPSVEQARRAAAEAGLADRVSYEVLDAAAGLPDSFDVITTFDVVHDAVDPLGLLRSIRDALGPGGSYLCLEINCSDQAAANTGPVATLLYGFSGPGNRVKGPSPPLDGVKGPFTPRAKTSDGVRWNRRGRAGVAGYPCGCTEVRMSGLEHEHPVSPERVAAARAGVLATGEAGRLAGLLGMLADPVRSRILFALSAAGELCVGDLALALEATEDQVSYALKMLRLAGMVSFRKDGRMVFYRLSDGFPHPLLEHCLRQLLSIASPEGHDASA